MRQLEESMVKEMTLLLSRLFFIIGVTTPFLLFNGCAAGKVKRCLPNTDLYFVDAQSQLPPFAGLSTADLKVILIRDRMLQSDVARTILSPRRGQTHVQVLKLANASPSNAKIFPAIATKQEYYERLEYRMENTGDKYISFGEVLLYHEEKREIRANEIINYPTSSKVQTIFDYAKTKGWPLVLHLEDAAMPLHIRLKMYRDLCQVGFDFSRDLPPNHPAKRETCDSPPDPELDMTSHPVVFTHLAQLSSVRVEKLLQRYPNLYFMVYHTEKTRSTNHPWTPTFERGVLLPEWAALFRKYPKRFLFSLDNVTEKHWDQRYIPVMEKWKQAFELLPDYVSRAIAHENAERLWDIPPLCYLEQPNIVQR